MARQLSGHLVHPGDRDWDEATRPWNGMVEASPAMVVQPSTTEDVVSAVRFARDRGLLLGVRGGGHNIAGTSIAEGGLNLDMSRMCEVTVDPDRGLAHVGPGCRLGDVDRATQGHGLATVLGFVSKVGVAGLTLGGGLGYLTRRFGWTVDNLAEVEIVTADGAIRIANRADNAELFWAVRGGGGNFGVVTRFTFRLHKVGPAVYGGLIAWPFERADEVWSTYRALTAEAPRELAVWMTMTHAPPAPFVPARWHGRKIFGAAVCHSGDLARTEEVLAPLRELGDPVFDLLAEQPYVRVQSYLDDDEPSGEHYYWKTEYVAELTDDLLGTMRDVFAECPIPLAELGMLHLAGALNEHAEDDGAVGNRDARYVLGVKGMWSPGEPREPEFVRWVRDAWQRVRPFTTGRTYVNFQTADEGEHRVRAAYGDNFARLVRVKNAYDPGNLFRVNRNITAQEPAATTAS